MSARTAELTPAAGLPAWDGALRLVRLSLPDEYERQDRWRPWQAILDALPPIRGRTVADLGCGVGDQAARLVARGARVIGIDANEELLDRARSRDFENAEFRTADLRSMSDLGTRVDGLWCSFAAAYFPQLADVLARWRRFLHDGGWIALTEVDDLFGHEPLGTRARALLTGYERDALAAGRYDFRMGRKLRGHLERAGFTVTRTMDSRDPELAFDGPARPEVVDAWRARFERVTGLRQFCGGEFAPLRDEFLRCLTAPDHTSRAKVVTCIATT